MDDATPFPGEAWSDPIEAAIRDRIRSCIKELIEEKPAAATGDVAPRQGDWHHHRRRGIICSFGPVEIAMPRKTVGYFA